MLSNIFRDHDFLLYAHGFWNGSIELYGTKLLGIGFDIELLFVTRNCKALYSIAFKDRFFPSPEMPR
jgi:hypothetical protein